MVRNQLKKKQAWIDFKAMRRSHGWPENEKSGTDNFYLLTACPNGRPLSETTALGSGGSRWLKTKRCHNYRTDPFALATRTATAFNAVPRPPPGKSFPAADAARTCL
jgi:hypothetical protein